MKAGSIARACLASVAMPDDAFGWLHQAYALRRITGGGIQAAWDALLPAADSISIVRESFPLHGSSLSMDTASHPAGQRGGPVAMHWSAGVAMLLPQLVADVPADCMHRPGFERSLDEMESQIARLLLCGINYVLNDLLSLAIRQTGLARGVVGEFPIAVKEALPVGFFPLWDHINEILAARWERAITFAVVRIERVHTC
jgi:hypothetical protein